MLRITGLCLQWPIANPPPPALPYFYGTNPPPSSSQQPARLFASKQASVSSMGAPGTPFIRVPLSSSLVTMLMSLPTTPEEPMHILIWAHFLSPFQLNSLWPSDTIWWQRSGSTLAQVIACCLTAPSHYLNQCWLIISEVQWYSYQGHFTREALTIRH